MTFGTEPGDFELFIGENSRDVITRKFSVNNQPASECNLPLATGSMHKWNKAEIGTINFKEAGLQLLTFNYNKGNNFACFEFIWMPEK